MQIGSGFSFSGRRYDKRAMRRLSYVLVALCLPLAGCGSGGTLGAKSLAQRAKAVQSHAAEGALLAENSVAGRTTSVYTREHASDLAKAAAREASVLRTARTDPALEPKLRRLRTVAARVAFDLDRLERASGDERRRLSRALSAVAQARLP
jgi:hypothetical protein